MAKETIDLEKLVQLTYSKHMADTFADQDDGLHYIERQADSITLNRTSTDGVASVMRQAPRHARWAAARSPEIPPDFEKVHKMVGWSYGCDPALLIKHGRDRNQPDWERNARGQEMYSDWHEGLVMLVRQLKRSPLEAYEVTGPKASAKPWLPRDTELSSKKVPPGY